MNFKNSSLIYINILTSVQYHSILKGISPSKRQYVFVTCTKICISTEIASLQHTPEHKYILKMITPWGNMGTNYHPWLLTKVRRGQEDKLFKIRYFHISILAYGFSLILHLATFQGWARGKIEYFALCLLWLPHPPVEVLTEHEEMGLEDNNCAPQVSRSAKQWATE